MAKRKSDAALPLSRLGVLVAQLESIAASAKHQTPDPLLCFDLLSELVSAIDEEPKEAVLQCQRKCEDALYSLLVLGARRPVRRLASLGMARIIAKGDSISIYSRVSSLQGWLVDGKRSEPLSCAGVAQCLGELYHLFGRKITSGLNETANIAAKLMKFHEDYVRQDALQMLHNALEGSAGSGAPAAYSEAFRVIIRNGLGDKVFFVRLAAAKCLKAFANIGGPGLGTSELENAASCCVKALEDPISHVRDAFAEALGALIALGMCPESKVIQRGKSALSAKKFEGGLQKHLIFPFIKASGIRAKDLRIGLTLSWVSFLQVMHLKYALPHTDLQNFAFEVMDMLNGNSSPDAHALACVLYIIRVGVTDQMSEPIQRIFLVRLAKQLESSDFSPLKGIAVLRILSYVLKVLGEVPTEFKEVIDNTVVAALSHSSVNVRIEAALTLRGLAEVDPICVAGLISYGVTTLYALRECASFEKGRQLKFEFDSLHGQATVLAALVSISPRLLLGYPARLPRSVFDVSKKMLTEYSRNSTVASVEKEAGWQLLASLIASVPKEELEDQVFDVLLLFTGFLGKYPESESQQSEDTISEIRVLSVAVEALVAFIRSFLSPTTGVNDGVLLQPVLVYLSGAISYILSLSSKKLGDIKPMLDLFTFRTLSAYTSLSDPMAYKSDHAQIIQICTVPFRDPYICEESSCLRLLLDKKDACLGPWIPGRDWFEDELRAFEGGKDGILPCVWENQICTFPQPETISKVLVNQMLLCFGRIFAIEDTNGKILLLNMIDQCLKSGKKQAWHAISVTNACVGLLSGLKTLLSLRPQVLENEPLTSIQMIFQGILAEGEISAAQRRAASEGFGLLARLGADSFTARMTRSLLGELTSATDPFYIGSLALSLGCVHRSAGGMALSAIVPASVSSLSLLSKSSNAVLQQWSLHALLLTIEAAGLSYVSQVQGTLFLAMEILLSEDSGRVDLRQAIARVINAIVAVLGPELSPGSTFFSRCKSVIAETSSGLETSTLIECVRFTQQLVLFAPQAVSVHSHVQTLLPTLSSRQPALRHLAVSTLLHLIEKDPVSIINEKIEENLFSMLDEETDSEIGNLVRIAIKRLFYASCPSRPSRWLVVCRNMVLTTSSEINTEDQKNSENDFSNKTSGADATLYLEEDNENMIAGSGSNKIQSSASVSTSDVKRNKNIRYRTRIFAAECLSLLPTAVGNDPAHFDLDLARKQQAYAHVSSRDWLVLHLQDLVSLAYQISTCQFEGLQPLGIELLLTIMEKFAKTPDPELPGHFLVEQYQAQFVSSVRSSVILSSSPLLLEAGLRLSAEILTSSIMNGDCVAVQRIFSLITRLLHEFKDLYYPSFAEWVACKIKIRLLAAHASIKCHVYVLLMNNGSPLDEYLQLVPLFSQISSMLGKYWISVLKDYCFILFSLQSKSDYKPFLDGIQSLVVSSKVRECLDEACPLILQAMALDAVPLKFEVEKYSKKGPDDIPKALLQSGYVMVRLEPGEFHFLWGLALLFLFQSQHSMGCLHVEPLSYYVKAKFSGGNTFKETDDERPSEIALQVFLTLSKEVFFSHGYLTPEICRELLLVLLHARQSSATLDYVAIPLLSQIVRFSPRSYYEMKDFVLVATELCVKYLDRIFRRSKFIALSQNHLCEDDLISVLLVAAEEIANHLDHVKSEKVLLAFLSASYGCIRRSSADSCLSKLVNFLRSIFPLTKKYFEDVAEFIAGDAYLMLSAWVTVIANVSEDCIKRIHTLGKVNSDSSKLLAKKLCFCLEDVISIARLAHESHCCDKMVFRSVYRSCTKCFQMTVCDTNKQVQAVGVHVLKQAAQKEVNASQDHSFFLFFAGETLGDIFILIQKLLMDQVSWESVAVLDECLRFLFLFHTLSQGSNFLQDAINVLLETISMVVSASDAFHSQELNQIKNVAMVLVSHLVQIPLSAGQIKEALLSMPVEHRRRLQDVIRASASNTQHEMQTQHLNSSPLIKLPMMPKPVPKEDSCSAVTSPVEEITQKEDKETNDDDFGDDDEWDAFQSFPTSTRAADPGAANGSPDDASGGESFIPESIYNYEEQHFDKYSSTATQQFDALHLEDPKDNPMEHEVREVELHHPFDIHPDDKGIRSSNDQYDTEEIATENAPVHHIHKNDSPTGGLVTKSDSDKDDFSRLAQPVDDVQKFADEHGSDDFSRLAQPVDDVQKFADEHGSVREEKKKKQVDGNEFSEPSSARFEVDENIYQEKDVVEVKEAQEKSGSSDDPRNENTGFLNMPDPVLKEKEEHNLVNSAENPEL